MTTTEVPTGNLNKVNMPRVRDEALEWAVWTEFALRRRSYYLANTPSMLRFVHAMKHIESVCAELQPANERILHAVT